MVVSTRREVLIFEKREVEISHKYVRHDASSGALAVALERKQSTSGLGQDHQTKPQVSTEHLQSGEFLTHSLHPKPLLTSILPTGLQIVLQVKPLRLRDALPITPKRAEPILGPLHATPAVPLDDSRHVGQLAIRVIALQILCNELETPQAPRHIFAELFTLGRKHIIMLHLDGQESFQLRLEDLGHDAVFDPLSASFDIRIELTIAV